MPRTTVEGLDLTVGERGGFGRLHQGPYLADTIPSDTTTWATVTAPGTFYGQIDTVGDQDWIRITLQAGVSYTFALNSQGGSTGLSDPYLAVYNSAGTLLTLDDDSGPGLNALIVFTPTTSGTYYLGASGIPIYTGYYALVVNGGGGDPIAGTTATTSSLAIDGATASSSIEAAGDQDWFRLSLVAGESYAFTLNSSGATPLSDAFLRLYDANGVLVSLDDDGGAGLNSMMQFTAATSGVYYLAAGGVAAATGAYTIGAAHGPAQNPLDTIDLRFTFDTNAINVYFALDGATHGPIGPADDGWTSNERASVMSALLTIANVTNLTFSEVTSASNADIIFMLTDLPSGVLAQTFPGPSMGYVEFSPGAPGWDSSGLTPGGLGYSTIIHEVLHALGLEHPHLDGDDIQVMQGVTSEFGSYGTFGLNQQVFTIMSYNDGWPQGPAGVSSSFGAGYAATPMALDIALLQQLYGADPARNQTNTVYTIDGGTSHSAYRAIWDTGGVDTIAYAGDANAVINLNAATLLNEVGGGGFVSYAGSVFGGYTIAHGVDIENGSGGAGNDEIIGNALANLLTGGAGADVLRGNDGNDRLEGGDGVDQLFGGGGDDVVVFDAADNPSNVQGGDGADILVFTGGDAPTSFGLIAHGFETAEGRFTDVGGNAWATFTQFYDAQWRLDLSTTINDDGSRETTDFDETNSVTWSTFLTRQDALGRATETVLTYDDASRDTTNFDAGNTVFWSSFVTRTDSLGRTTETLLIHDDGTRDTTNFDGDNSQFWTSFVTRRDSLGRQTESLLIHDDGVRDTTNYDADESQFWTSFVTRRDALGRTTESLLIHDDGTRDTTNYDADGSQFWTSFVTRRDALGRQTESLLIHDDGTRDTTNFDPENNVFWSSFVTRRDALGRTTDTLLIYDDGRRDSTDYDEANASDWVSVVYRYDSSGELYQTITTYDDGHVVTI